MTLRELATKIDHELAEHGDEWGDARVVFSGDGGDLNRTPHMDFRNVVPLGKRLHRDLNMETKKWEYKEIADPSPYKVVVFSS